MAPPLGNLVEVPFEGDFSLRDTLKSGQIFHWETIAWEGLDGFAGCIGEGSPAFVCQDETGLVQTFADDLARVRRYFGLDHSAASVRAAFPDTPIIADLKTMDGGYLEAEMMAKAGATHVVVMARAHAETVKCVVKAGADFGVGVMGDNMICEDMVAGAKWLEDLGCDYVIHHVGYDERRGIAAAGHRMPSPLDQLREVVAAVKIPVQAVGGLSLEQAIQCPQYGAPLVVLGAPLTIDADSFKTADGNLEASLRMICDAVHSQTVPARA
jgi:3-hexulose-6-phosphate synthase/6-phospho-3-hexuloisomerase